MGEGSLNTNVLSQFSRGLPGANIETPRRLSKVAHQRPITICLTGSDVFYTKKDFRSYTYTRYKYQKDFRSYTFSQV